MDAIAASMESDPAEGMVVVCMGVERQVGRCVVGGQVEDQVVDGRSEVAVADQKEGLQSAVRGCVLMPRQGLTSQRCWVDWGVSASLLMAPLSGATVEEWKAVGAALV